MLLDAALRQGIDIPHDCRSGHCGTCRTRVVAGRLLGGNCDEPGVARACQARLIGDVAIKIDAMPEILSTAGRVRALTKLTRDVIEVSIEPARPVRYLPGQYFQVRFRGFPARCFSPTLALDAKDDTSIRLHIRLVPNGRVSSAFGSAIRSGHSIKIEGPFGSAYLREDNHNRLVLIAGGTGFAPIWSIAAAALRENPHREIVVVVGARSLDDLYMTPALCWLARHPNVTVVPVTDTPQTITRAIRTGRPTDHAPILTRDDTVYACGAPPMVQAAQRMAAMAGARCYADAFVPAGVSEDGLLARTVMWVTSRVPSAA